MAGQSIVDLVQLPFLKQRSREALRCGQVEVALQLLHQAYQTDNGDADTHYLLAICHSALGHYAEALKWHRQSILINPGLPQYHYALGQALYRSGQLEEAADCLRAALELNDGMVLAHVALAHILFAKRAVHEARLHYEKALQIKPTLAEALQGIGRILHDQDRLEEALSYYEQAKEIRPDSVSILNDTGAALTFLGRRQDAERHFMQVLESDPDNVEALTGLGVIYEWEGDYHKAYEVIAPLIDRGVEHVMLGVVFAKVCRHFGNCDQAIAYGETVLSRANPSARGEQKLHKAIGHCMSRMGRYDAAFAHYKSGNEQIYIPYDPVGHATWIKEAINVFSMKLFWRVPHATVASERPVFIIGMPRSGTTLTEQILASHPEIHGAGELREINDLVESIPALIGSHQIPMRCIPDLDQKNIDRLADHYLTRLRELAPTARRVTDKMPHNFYWLGLIQLLFPGARVIHCRRDPLDTCLSIYFQDFKDGHAYAKDLYLLGTHYHQYLRLMEHWHHTLSLPVLEVQYEELVHDQETISRQMIEFCGLEWDDSCLQFNRLKRVVRYRKLRPGAPADVYFFHRALALV